MLDVATVCLPIPPTTRDCSLFTRFLLYLRSFAFGHHARPEAFDNWTTAACGAKGAPYGAHDATQRHNAPLVPLAASRDRRRFAASARTRCPHEPGVACFVPAIPTILPTCLGHHALLLVVVVVENERV